MEKREEGASMKKIMLIDDDVVFGEIVKDHLEESNYNVNLQSCARKALKDFREEPCQMVITDILIPQKDGIEVIRELKKDFPAIPVLAISGGGSLDSKGYLELASKFGARFCYSKHDPLERLVQMVDKAFTEI